MNLFSKLNLLGRHCFNLNIISEQLKPFGPLYLAVCPTSLGHLAHKSWPIGPQSLAIWPINFSQRDHKYWPLASQDLAIWPTKLGQRQDLAKWALL